MFRLGYLDDDKGIRTTFARQFGNDFEIVMFQDMDKISSLEDLLTALEEGSALRRVDRFTVRSGRAEILVKVYGIDAGVSQALRQAAQRRASDTPAAR